MASMKFVLAAGALAATCLAAVSVGCEQAAQSAPPVVNQQLESAHQGASAAVEELMKGAPPGELPPLPEVNYAPSRPMPVVMQVYEFAARHPEVLHYIPCYCGCERQGHRGNHDCFVKSRAADGRIVEWDAHGIGCAVCLEVGRRAMTLFNEKKSVAEIRSTIDREFGSQFKTQTPTPDPPPPTKG